MTTCSFYCKRQNLPDFCVFLPYFIAYFSGLAFGRGVSQGQPPGIQELRQREETQITSAAQK